MKNIHSIFIKIIFCSLVLLYACEDSSDLGITPSYVFSKEEIPYKVEILTNTREIVMKNDKPWELAGLYYFNVIKTKDNLWQMWYASMDKRTNGDYDTHLCYANSIDGKSWVKNISSEDKTNIIKHSNDNLRQGWVEAFVFLDNNDKATPYRIIYTAIDNDGIEKTFMAKSEDGVEWKSDKIIWNSKHDSQFSVRVLENGNYLIFLRLWNNAHTDRQIGFAIITPEGKTITYPVSILTGSAYNSAASHLDNSNYIIFPTIFNPKSENINIKVGFILNGKGGLTTQDITHDLFFNTNTNWGIVAPGLISTEKPNEYWLYYYGRPTKHNTIFQTIETTYYRIKISINNNNHISASLDRSK